MRALDKQEQTKMMNNVQDCVAVLLCSWNVPYAIYAVAGRVKLTNKK
jgi:hypothetical protein